MLWQQKKKELKYSLISLILCCGELAMGTNDEKNEYAEMKLWRRFASAGVDGG